MSPTALRADAIAWQPGEPADRARRWKTAAETIAEPPREEVIEGVAWADSITILVGESGAGKSFVLADASAAVGADLDWHGRRVRHGSVVIVPFEGSLGLRFRALREVGGHWLRNVYVVPGTDPLSPIIDRDRLELPSRGEIDLAASLDAIAEHIHSNNLPPIVLVVIDTLRASLAGSEESSETTSAYLRTGRRLMGHTPGAAWVFAHHAGWQDGQDRRKRERGSSAIRGNVDATLYLEADEYDRQQGEARLTLTALKVRDGEPPSPLHLIRRRVEIPGLADRWGNPMTSCLIDSDRRSREDREADQKRATEAAIRALDLRVLRVIAERPALATSQEKLRSAVVAKRDAVYQAIARLLERGWALPPETQRGPYTPTPEGLAALASAPTAAVVPSRPHSSPGRPPSESSPPPPLRGGDDSRDCGAESVARVVPGWGWFRKAGQGERTTCPDTSGQPVPGQPDGQRGDL